MTLYARLIAEAAEAAAVDPALAELLLLAAAEVRERRKRATSAREVRALREQMSAARKRIRHLEDELAEFATAEAAVPDSDWRAPRRWLAWKKMHDAGLSQSEIARRVGKHPTTIGHALARLGEVGG